MSLSEYKEHPIFQQNPQLVDSIDKAVKASTFHIVVSIAIKLLFTLILVFSFVKFVSALSNDIKIEQQQEKEEFEREIENCKKDYYLNKCHTGENFHIPGLKDECSRLRVCMETKPRVTSPTEIAVKFVAKSIDSFYSHLTTQTTIKIGITIALIVFVLKIIS